MYPTKLYSVSVTVSSCPEVMALRKYSSTSQQCMEDTVIACIALGDKSFAKIQNQGGFMLISLML